MTDAEFPFSSDAHASAKVRTHPFDLERMNAGLRGRVFRSRTIAGHPVEVVAEPLLRRGEHGLEQPIRVRTTERLACAEVWFDERRMVRVPAERGPDGYRFFVPEQTDERIVALALPELGDDRIEVALGPVRRWTVSLVHHSHLDIGYTDPQGRVIVEQLSYLDDALRLAEAVTEEDSSAFRWSVESIWILREWIARRSPAVVDRFMEQVRRGRIELAALPFNVHTEGCSTEELHGLMRYARDISERFGVDLPVAYQTDIPGCVAGLVDALADNGVKYLAVAHNWAGRSMPYLSEDGARLPRLFRWAAPSGRSILVWMTTSAQGIAYQEGAVLGFHDSVEVVEDLFPLYLRSEEEHGFPFDENCFGFALGDRALDREPYPWAELHLRVMGRVADNAPPVRRLGEVVAAWNERWEYPKLAVARTQDFFEQMEAQHADEIQTFTGDWNNWWADGNGSSARHVQLNRDAQHALAQADSVMAMVDAHASARGFRSRMDAAWEAVDLFDEHTWGSAFPWMFGDERQESGADSWSWKAEKAIRAQQDGSLLTQEALRAYADARGGAGDASIWVVNTASTARGGLVRAFVPESLVHTVAEIRLTDARTGAGIPFAERDQQNPNHRDAGRFVEFVLHEVPAFGAARVDIVVVSPAGRIVAADGTRPLRPAADPVWDLDNGCVRVRISPRDGSIRSIRVGERELVDAASAFGFNAYVHDRLATHGGFNHTSGFLADHGPDLVLLAGRATPTHVAFEDAGSDAVSTWVRFRSFGDGVDSITTTVRLTAGAAHVDIENRVCKQYTEHKESGFFAFPFAISAPTIRYEITGSVAGSDIETVPGGADYMHSVRDWISLSAAGQAVALVTQDAPLVQLGDIALPFAPFPGTLPRREPATVFSWIHNNIWDTNFATGQAFDMVFRYRVGAHDADSPEVAGLKAADLARDLVRPLLGVAADVGGDPVAAESGLAIGDPRVRLLSATRTDDGRLLVKLQSIAESAVETELQTVSTVRGAWDATLIGTERAALAVVDARHVPVRIPRFGTAAVLLALD